MSHLTDSDADSLIHFVQDIDRLTSLEMLRLANNKLKAEFQENVQGADDVRALMVRMMAPVACQKAVQCLWCVHRFRKDETVSVQCLCCVCLFVGKCVKCKQPTYTGTHSRTLTFIHSHRALSVKYHEAWPHCLGFVY